MLEYSKDIFECYLDKQPKYPFPVSKQHALGDLNNLRPSIEGIQIHHHGNQCAVVVEGSNLWFCYQISFRGQKLPIPASEISGSAIQLINMSGQRESLSSGRERVTLFNYFKSKSNYQDVEVHEKVRLNEHFMYSFLVLALYPAPLREKEGLPYTPTHASISRAIGRVFISTLLQRFA